MEHEAASKEEEDFVSAVVLVILKKAVSQLVINEQDGGGDSTHDRFTGHRGDDPNDIGCHGDTSQDNLPPSLRQNSGEEVNPTKGAEFPDETMKQTEADRNLGIKNTDHQVSIQPNTDGSNAIQNDRERSSVSSRMLEVHLPHDAAFPAGCDVPGHGAISSGITNPVSQTLPYPPAAPRVRDHQSPPVTSKSPSSRLIQFPQRRHPRDVDISGGGLRKSREASPRQRIPPSLMRMSTVHMNTRARAEKQRMMSTFFEERGRTKLLSLDQCINSRPPMPFDLDNPGPCRYTPPNKALHESNSPKYTFGHRFYERGGGGRTAWSKSWFNSRNSETIKVNFEDKWPSPANHSGSRSLIGQKLPSKMTYPSFTIGVRKNFSISKRGSEKEPSPNAYDPSKADRVTYHRAPSFTMSFRHKGTSLWTSSELTPAPDIYTPRLVSLSSKPHRPAFTIQGIRRPKSHVLGPHSTI